MPFPKNFLSAVRFVHLKEAGNVKCWGAMWKVLFFTNYMSGKEPPRFENGVL